MQSKKWHYANSPYSSSLAPCDYHILGELKKSLRGMRFENDDSLVNDPNQCLRYAGSRWCNAVEMTGNCEKKLLFVPQGRINIKGLDKMNWQSSIYLTWRYSQGTTFTYLQYSFPTHLSPSVNYWKASYTINASISFDVPY